jgi:hypothetical protein
MAECTFTNHDWGGSTDRSGDRQTSTFRCRLCGVGHTLDLRFRPNDTVEAGLVIFPATGSETVSRDIIRFLMLGYEQTCAQIRDDGLTLIEATPEVHGIAVGV